MDSRWYKGATSTEDKAARKKAYEQSGWIREMLAEILVTEIKETTPDYDCPSWSHKQADQNGSNRAVRSILKLLK